MRSQIYLRRRMRILTIFMMEFYMVGRILSESDP